MRSRPLASGRGAAEPVSQLFYSYAYPSPKGFAGALPTPDGAYFDQRLGQFLLPYEVVRKSTEPETTLMAFLASTYAPQPTWVAGIVRLLNGRSANLGDVDR
jgi:hypothetical protein